MFQNPTYLIDPNLSIVLPGPCNAKCKFCFWADSTTKRFKLDAYLNRVESILSALPSNFKQISLTGGEPTLSPAFEPVLKLINSKNSLKQRYKKVVLTTNGIALAHYQNVWNSRITHLNISRHHHDQDLNDRIFGAPQIKANQITAMCDYANEWGIPAALNCVLSPAMATKEDVLAYINFAKSVDANSVCFRKKFGTLKPTKLELSLRTAFKIFSETGCPVCRSTEQIIKGMSTVWRAGMVEPSTVLGGKLYELIIQPNGILTTDWKGDYRLDLNKERPVTKRSEVDLISTSSSRCGGSLSRC